MSLLRNVLRATQTTVRPLHTTSRLRWPYKGSQDRESLRPVTNENTKSGRDEQVATAQTRNKTSKEGPEGEDPLNASGANQDMSKPLGDEKTIKKTGAGKETSKGGASQEGTAPKKGEPQKV
ncbi:hypothetical protein NW754_016068 [Fusarium falciforme]|nr:hypothetical protein NW754_016068 [Fusarium falciforme]